ncbi:3190_t:CDS:2 [Dentiscutata heterogama]|uniref:3190_t:CDS:1 n=1 Tax=Dentiscutata heterogama TaxID=1316150 RepID=A0ACA9LGA0_9GLOM|nr:3190_t:CDS:2 [Dentiscutata heterogama]
MKKVAQNRSNSSNKPQDIFRNETQRSYIIKERLKRQQHAYLTMMKDSLNREIFNNLPQDKTYRYESSYTISTKHKLKRRQRKFMLELQRSNTLPSKSETRLNEPLRSNSLPNNTPLSEFYYPNPVFSVFSSSPNTTQQNIYSYQLVEEPGTYYIQPSGPNNETYNDEAFAIEETTSIMLYGRDAYPNPISRVGIGHMSNDFENDWTYKILYVQYIFKLLDICPMPTLYIGAEILYH